MAKNTKSARSSRKTSLPKTNRPFKLLTVFLNLLVVCVWSQPDVRAEELLDQTVAVVGKEVLTLHDVKVERIVSRALDTPRSLSDEQLTNILVRRSLINQNLDSVGLLTEIPPERLARMRAKTSSESSALSAIGVTEPGLDLRLRKRIRSELFMEQQLPSRITLTDTEVRAYYESQKAHRFLGKPFESVEQIVRADLRRERLQKEFERWLETELRRTEVRILPLQK
jgi:hypothetical protein